MASPITCIVITIILAVVHCAPQTTEANTGQNVDLFEKECAENSNVSLDDAQKRRGLESYLSATEDMKVFDKCMLEKIGVVAADGTIVDNVAIKAFSVGRQDKIDVVTKAFKKCKPLSDGQNTSSALHEVLKCTVTDIMSNW